MIPINGNRATRLSCCSSSVRFGVGDGCGDETAEQHHDEEYAERHEGERMPAVILPSTGSETKPDAKYQLAVEDAGCGGGDDTPPGVDVEGHGWVGVAGDVGAFPR